MNWRDDPYITALVRGAVLFLSAILLGGGVACLCMYLIGFQKEAIWVSIALLLGGALALAWHMAEINGVHEKRKRKGD